MDVTTARLRTVVRAQIAQWTAEHPNEVRQEDDTAVDVVIGQVSGKFTPGTPSALLRLALHGESLARCAPDEAPERASAVELFAACVREARWDAMWGEWGKPQD